EKRLGVIRRLDGRRRALRAVRDELVDRAARRVVDREREAAVEQAFRHVRAHAADADEGVIRDVHVVSPVSSLSMPRSYQLARLPTKKLISIFTPLGSSRNSCLSPISSTRFCFGSMPWLLRRSSIPSKSSALNAT